MTGKIYSVLISYIVFEGSGMPDQYQLNELVKFTDELRSNLEKNAPDRAHIGEFITPYSDHKLSNTTALTRLLTIHEQYTPDDREILEKIQSVLAQIQASEKEHTLACELLQTALNQNENDTLATIQESERDHEAAFKLLLANHKQSTTSHAEILERIQGDSKDHQIAFKILSTIVKQYASDTEITSTTVQDIADDYVKAFKLLLSTHQQCIKNDTDTQKTIRENAKNDEDKLVAELLKYIYLENKHELYNNLQALGLKLDSASLIAIGKAYKLNPLAIQHLLKTEPIDLLFSLSAGFSSEERCGSTTAFSNGLLHGEKPRIHRLSDLELGTNETFFPWVARSVNLHNYCICVIPVIDDNNPNQSHWVSLFISDPGCNGKLNAQYFSTSASKETATTVRNILESYKIQMDMNSLVLLDPEHSEKINKHSAEANALFLFFCLLQQKVILKDSFETTSDILMALPEKALQHFLNLLTNENLERIAMDLSQGTSASYMLNKLLQTYPRLFSNIRKQNIADASLNISHKDFMNAVTRLAKIIQCPLSSDPSNKEVAILLLSILAIATGQYAHLKLLTLTGATGCTALGLFKLAHTQTEDDKLEKQIVQHAKATFPAC